MKVAVCGRRWGKTTVGLISVVGGHGPARVRRGAQQGGKIWWVAPSHPVAAEIWRDLKVATRNAWTHKDEVEKRIELPGGGSVTVRSAVDPETLVAAGLDGLVLDEAAKIKHQAWDMLRPTLADKKGWAIFIGTPKGYNWIWDKFEYAARAEGWARWQRPSSDNPLMTQEELDKARADAPRLFGQEYLARFEMHEGAEWPPEYFPDSIWFKDWPKLAWEKKAIALDPSKGKDRTAPKDGREPDYSAYCIGAVASDGVVWIEADLDNGRDADRLVEDGIQHFRNHQPQAILVEANQFQILIGDLFVRKAKEKNLGALPLYTVINTENKELRIRTVGPFLAQRQIRVRDTPGGRLLVQQLRDFPAGEYDDGPDALSMLLRMLLYLILGPQPGQGQPALLRA